MMGGVSPETCWVSYKYEIKFWCTVASCLFVNVSCDLNCVVPRQWLLLVFYLRPLYSYIAHLCLKIHMLWDMTLLSTLDDMAPGLFTNTTLTKVEVSFELISFRLSCNLVFLKNSSSFSSLIRWYVCCVSAALGTNCFCVPCRCTEVLNI
jgi:hypothetical protein